MRLQKVRRGSVKLQTLPLALCISLFMLSASHAAADSCVRITEPFSTQNSGSRSISQGDVYNSEQRLCYQLPSPSGTTETTDVIRNGASVSSGGSFRLYVPERSTKPDVAAVFDLRDSTVDAANAPLITFEQLPNQVSGRLRVNIIDTKIGAGRTLSFAPNGGLVSPSELYIGSTKQRLRDRQIDYRNLTIQDATFIDIGSYKIATSENAPVSLGLYNSTITGTGLFALREGSQLYTNSGTSISALVGIAEGIYSGDGTFSGTNFSVKSTGQLVPGLAVGTLQFDSDLTFSRGSQIVAQVDPISTGQKADLVASSGSIIGADNATIVIQPARSGLTAQDYASGNNYTVATATSIDGSAPTVVAGGGIPALATPRLANDPAADGRIDIRFDSISSNKLHKVYTTLPKQTVGGGNIASAIAVTANTTSTPGGTPPTPGGTGTQPPLITAGNNGNIVTPGPGGSQTKLTNGTTLAVALTTLTHNQLAGFNSIHAEPYSSYMTVSLEQMEEISSAVLSHAGCVTRDGAPALSNQSTSSVATLGATASMHSLPCNGSGVWLDASLTRGQVNGDGNLGRFSYTLNNLVAGVDIVAEPDRGLGFFVGIGRLTMDEHDQVDQRIETDALHAGIYGRVEYPQLSMKGMIGVVRENSSSERTNPNLGQFTGGTATADFKSSGFYASGEVTKHLDVLDGLHLAPRFGATYAKIWQQSVSETGGGDFNYNIASAQADSFVTSLGLDISKSYLTNAGKFTPMAFTRLDFDWLADKDSEHEVLVTSPLFGSHIQTGQNRGAWAGSIGLGAQFEVSESTQFSAGYVFTKTANGQEHGLGANFEMTF